MTADKTKSLIMRNEMTDNQKQILVIGATGQQGGSVAQALLSNGWFTWVLTRDKATDKDEALRVKGAEIVEGDLDILDYHDHLAICMKN